MLFASHVFLILNLVLKALRTAAIKGYVDVVTKLLEAGANVHAGDDWVRNFERHFLVLGLYMLHTELRGDIFLVICNCSFNFMIKALRIAAIRGLVGMVTKLLEAGANVHVGNDWVS